MRKCASGVHSVYHGIYDECITLETFKVEMHRWCSAGGTVNVYVRKEQNRFQFLNKNGFVRCFYKYSRYKKNKSYVISSEIKIY